MCILSSTSQFELKKNYDLCDYWWDSPKTFFDPKTLTTIIIIFTIMTTIISITIHNTITGNPNATTIICAASCTDEAKLKLAYMFWKCIPWKKVRRNNEKKKKKFCILMWRVRIFSKKKMRSYFRFNSWFPHHLQDVVKFFLLNTFLWKLFWCVFH